MSQKPDEQNSGGKPGRYHHGNLREALIEAAEVELTENGIEQLSLRAIAKRAGVSHAAPAHHFGDVNGLLTALAATGYTRFVTMQKARQQVAPDDPSSQLVASGLGYIDFALAHPALFRLMFSSHRPDFDDPALNASAGTAFGLLLNGVRQVSGSDPETNEDAMGDMIATWAIAHGLADLLCSGRLKSLQGLSKVKRDAMLTGIIRRILPAGREPDAREQP